MQIETERLILREFRPDDCLTMAAYWQDPLYQRYNPELDDVVAAARQLCRTFIDAQSDEPRRKWQLAIALKDSGELVGNCGIRVNAPEHREANIGYELNPQVWGRGYATEAAWAVVRFGFEELDLHRIWAETVADNVGSTRVLDKLGMQREGHLRENKWFRDRWWDTCIYAVLEDEWGAREE